MSNSLSGVGGYPPAPPMSMQGPRRGQHPDADQIASRLFEKLDTAQQGYLEASDFETAIAQLASGQDKGSELFSALDEDGDGKLTQTELATRLKALQEQLDQQFHALRTQGGTPPPPPPPEEQDDDGEVSFARGQPYARAEPDSPGNDAGQVMRQVMALMQAYGGDASPTQTLHLSA